MNCVIADPGQFAVNSEKDFTRQRKITPDTLISFLVSKGSSSARVEMLDFWALDQEMPSLPALNQQRAKLRPDALEAVLAGFNHSVTRQAGFPSTDDGYRYLAADGSATTFFSSPKLAPTEYSCSPGHSASGVYCIHINAFFDLDAHIYTDAILQPVHEKNEFGAFCDIVDRHGTLPGRKNVYIGDRGYCSYNNMAHVVEQGQYFLFRTKDIHSKGLVGNFEFPETESFDIDVAVTLTRSHSRKIPTPPREPTDVSSTRHPPSILLNMAPLAHIRLLSVSPGSQSAMIPTSASCRISQGKNFLPKGSRSSTTGDGPLNPRSAS